MSCQDTRPTEDRHRTLEADRLELRIQLLQELSVLEGKMSVSTAVEQGHLYDLLCIVRELVNR